jgi:hypothetical protein
MLGSVCALVIFVGPALATPASAFSISDYSPYVGETLTANVDVADPQVSWFQCPQDSLGGCTHNSLQGDADLRGGTTFTVPASTVGSRLYAQEFSGIDPTGPWYYSGDTAPVQPAPAGQVGAGADAGCAAVPQAEGGVTVPGGGAPDALVDGASVFIPVFDVDTDPAGSTADDGLGTVPNPGDQTGDQGLPGAPAPGLCGDGSSVTKVTVGEAHASKVTCYLDKSNPPHSEVFPPERIAPVPSIRKIRVGGYSSCEGHTHGEIERKYTICAQEQKKDGNGDPQWYKMKPCRTKDVTGFGTVQLGHDTRCKDAWQRFRRTFVRMVVGDSYTLTVGTKLVLNPYNGVLLDCGFR